MVTSVTAFHQTSTDLYKPYHRDIFALRHDFHLYCLFIIYWLCTKQLSLFLCNIVSFYLGCNLFIFILCKWCFVFPHVSTWTFHKKELRLLYPQGEVNTGADCSRLRRKNLSRAWQNGSMHLQTPPAKAWGDLKNSVGASESQWPLLISLCKVYIVQKSTLEHVSMVTWCKYAYDYFDRGWWFADCGML